MKRIARVFPSRTTATPDDALAFVNCGPGLFPPEVDEVHISVVFTWDKCRAIELAFEWENVAPVFFGGPGWSNDPSGEFVPGRYLRPGYTITSRGCPNRCWFCSVWKREPQLKELPVVDGWIVQDDNLLACSERHIRSVFDMLSRQRKGADIRGLESKLLRSWHVELFRASRINSLWFACDTTDDYDPLVAAGSALWGAGFNREKLGCYVLVGFAGDTFEAAEGRLRSVWRAGFMPFAMLYADPNDNKNTGWSGFSRSWCRQASVKALCKSEPRGII
jgi:hypothetical protein